MIDYKLKNQLPDPTGLELDPEGVRQGEHQGVRQGDCQGDRPIKLRSGSILSQMGNIALQEEHAATYTGV